jgi:hypothetical protein
MLIATGTTTTPRFCLRRTRRQCTRLPACLVPDLWWGPGDIHILYTVYIYSVYILYSIYILQYIYILYSVYIYIVQYIYILYSIYIMCIYPILPRRRLTLIQHNIVLSPYSIAILCSKGNPTKSEMHRTFGLELSTSQQCTF